MTEKAKELIESVKIKNFVFEDEFTYLSGDYIPKSDFTRIVEQLCEEIEELKNPKIKPFSSEWWYRVGQKALYEAEHYSWHTYRFDTAEYCFYRVGNQ